MDDFVLEPQFSVDVPNLFDHFGIWMVEPEFFRAAVSRVQGINLHAHIKSEEAAERVQQQSRASYNSTADGIAVFDVRGPLMKQASSFSNGTSTVRLRQQLRAARNSADISGGIMVMDTPGGTARGNSDLADEARRFAQAKPLLAFVEDMTASAGVAIASQATQIWANNDAAMYGSMGTYAVLEDTSGAAEKLGIVVHVIKAGEFKGMGEPGTKITEEMLEEIQRIVSRLNDQYLQIIASGRSRTVDSIRPLADGRVIFADDAKANGLIDQIGPFGRAMATIRNLAGVQKKAPVQNTNPLSKEADTMDPATLQELEQAFPNAGSDWILSQLKAGATMLDASKAYAQHLEQKAKEDTEKHQKELEEVRAEALKQTGTVGHQPFTSESGGEGSEQETGDPVEDFDGAVLAHMNSHRCDRLTAVDAVRRKNPKLAQAYTFATNKSAYAKRVLSERYDALGVA